MIDNMKKYSPLIEFPHSWYELLGVQTLPSSPKPWNLPTSLTIFYPKKEKGKEKENNKDKDAKVIEVLRILWKLMAKSKHKKAKAQWFYWIDILKERTIIIKP